MIHRRIILLYKIIRLLIFLKILTHPCPPGSSHPGCSGNNRQTGKTLTHPCSRNLLNHPFCGKAAREGFRGPDSATVIRLIPRRTKRRCHILVRSDRAIPGALRFSFFCAASAVYITYCVNRILTWFPESSQRRHKTKRRVTLNHSLCGKAAK